MNKSNKLFEELLGDDASAFHNNNNNNNSNKGKDDGESTQMSSILGPILRDKEHQNNNNKSSDNMPTPRSGKKIRNDVQSTNNNNNNGLGNLYSPRKNSGSNNQQLSHRNQHTPTTQNNSQQQKRRSSKEQHYEEDDEETLDTYMTKPRIIKFDSNSDDVSALFGGGGASQLGGVESYRGTYAKKRQGKGTGGGGGGLVMGRSGRNIEENSRQTGRTGATSTFQSHGVNSILEEIGLRPYSSSKKFSDMNEEGYNNEASEYTGKSRSTMFKNDNTDNMKIPPSRRKRNNTRQNQNSGTKNMIVIIVGVIFITIQFTTVHKRDKATMQNMNWRFNNHKFDTAPQGSNGLGSVNSMQRVRQMAEQQQQNLGNQRRRGGTYDTEPNEDGLGDVLRKTVPLVNGQPGARKKKDLWEREQERVMFDDQLDNLNTHDRNENSAQNNLRGGGGSQLLGDGTGNQMMKQQQQIEQLQRDLEHHDQIQKHQIQMAIPKQQPAVQQQAQQQQLPPPPKPIQNIGDTHPLLAPQKGLSMSDAADKLGAASDKLSDIDPRPQQSLTNDIIPARFSVFADLKTPYVKGRDTPFFWHIPRSGGVIVKTMLSHCLGQTLAAEVGEMNGHGDDPEIKVVQFAEHNYTNVNIATPDGISRALNLGLVPSHLADTIVSAHVDLIPSLFNANDQARAFVLFRHPVDRAASMFYFLKGTGYPPLKNMTVDDYAKSELIENNWLVRILSESMTGPIDMDNLEVAKEVLRRKFIVGLLDNKRGTFARFDHYFKWKDSPDYEKEFGCRKQLMDEKYVAKHPIRKDSDTWKLLHEQNRFDVHLYDFAKELFSQQSYIFGL